MCFGLLSQGGVLSVCMRVLARGGCVGVLVRRVAGNSEGGEVAWCGFFGYQVLMRSGL